jgi:hypothetical protein
MRRITLEEFAPPPSRAAMRAAKNRIDIGGDYVNKNLEIKIILALAIVELLKQSVWIQIYLGID